MTDETSHIATTAAMLDDPYAALSQHLHGDGAWRTRALAAEAEIERLAAENDRLRAERDAAWQAGAEAMRSAAKRTCVLSAQDLAEGDWGPEGRDMAAMLEFRVDALPLPVQ